MKNTRSNIMAATRKLIVEKGYSDMTTKDVAKEAQVKQLILTHISARYLTKEAYQLQEEAQEIFPNTKIVKDMDIIEIPFANEGGA